MFFETTISIAFVAPKNAVETNWFPPLFRTLTRIRSSSDSNSEIVRVFYVGRGELERETCEVGPENRALAKSATTEDQALVLRCFFTFIFNFLWLRRASTPRQRWQRRVLGERRRIRLGLIV